MIYETFLNNSSASTISNNLTIGTYMTDNTVYPTYPNLYESVFKPWSIEIPAEKPKRPRKPRAEDPLTWLRHRVAEVSWTPA